MSDVELATFCCAYLTGEQMLERAGLKAGERVLVTGASGGVGSGIVQLARARGAIPYAVVGKGKEQAVLDIGAEAVITRGVADLPRAVAEVTGGRPIDVVADLVGGAIFNDLLRILRPEGRYTTAGAIAGPVVQLDLRTMKLMSPTTAELPRFLSARGGSRQGYAELQKPLSALEAEIRHLANPMSLSPLAVSDGIEDQSSMAPRVVAKTAEIIERMTGQHHDRAVRPLPGLSAG